MGRRFRQWAEASFKIKESQLSRDLESHEFKRKELQKLKEMEEKQHEKEAEELAK